MCAVSAACMAVIPAKILPEYGSPIVTGSAMLTAGVVSCAFVQPWAHMPALDAAGIEALAVFVVIGSFFAYMLYMQGVKDIARCVRASSELWSRFRRPSPAPLCWARCFCRPTLSLCHDHRDDVPHGVAGAAAKTEKVLCRIFANLMSVSGV